jgi:hypothetical protein
MKANNFSLLDLNLLPPPMTTKQGMWVVIIKNEKLSIARI